MMLCRTICFSLLSLVACTQIQAEVSASGSLLLTETEQLHEGVHGSSSSMLDSSSMMLDIGQQLDRSVKAGPTPALPRELLYAKFSDLILLEPELYVVWSAKNASHGLSVGDQLVSVNYPRQRVRHEATGSELDKIPAGKTVYFLPTGVKNEIRDNNGQFWDGWIIWYKQMISADRFLAFWKHITNARQEDKTVDDFAYRALKGKDLRFIKAVAKTVVKGSEKSFLQNMMDTTSISGPVPFRFPKLMLLLSHPLVYLKDNRSHVKSIAEIVHKKLEMAGALNQLGIDEAPTELSAVNARSDSGQLTSFGTEGVQYTKEI